MFYDVLTAHGTERFAKIKEIIQYLILPNNVTCCTL